MKSQIQVDNRAADQLRRKMLPLVQLRRKDLIERAARQALGEIVRLNPVDTARSRAAWVASLEQLKAAPPAGWEGDHPTGVSQGKTEGHLQRRDDPDLTELAVTNHVGYVGYLEYGTSRRPPAAMVRTSLMRLLPRLREWFRLT